MITELAQVTQSIGGAFTLVGFILGLAVIMALAWARGLKADKPFEGHWAVVAKAHGHPHTAYKANCPYCRKARYTWYYNGR